VPPFPPRARRPRHEKEVTESRFRTLADDGEFQRICYAELLCNSRHRIEIAQCAAGRVAATSNGNGEVRYCRCHELVIDNRRVPAPKFHDCNYTHQRSGLVSEAERTANRLVKRGPDQDGDEFINHAWMRCFAREMERLSAPLLRQLGNGTHEQKAV